MDQKVFPCPGQGNKKMTAGTVKKSLFIFLLGIFHFVPFLPSQCQTGKEIIRRAEELEGAGRLDEACLLYEKVGENDPDFGAAFQGLKDLYIRTDQLEKALALVELQIKRMPNDLGLQSCIGEMLWRKDRKQEARDVWNGILDRNPKSLSAYQSVAGSMSGVKLFDDAIRVYQSGRVRMERRDLFALNLEALYASRMDYGNAAEELIVFLEANPSQVSFVTSQFFRYPKTDRVMKDILERLQDRNRANPGNQGIVEILVSMNLESEHYQEARSWTEVVERISPEKKRGTALFRFGQELEKHGQTDMAVDVYLDMIRRFPDLPILDQIWIRLAQCRQKQGRYPEAVEAYKALIHHNPKSVRVAEALFEKASIESENLFLLAEAESTYQTIIRKHPSSKEYAEAWLRLGDCRIRQGDLDGAESFFQDLLQQQKKKGRIWLKTQIRTADVSFLRQDFEKGISQLEPLIHEKIETDGYGDTDFNDGMERLLFIREFKDSDPEGLRLMARAELFGRQRLADHALAVLDTLCRRQPPKPIEVHAHFIKGTLQVDLGRFRDAMEEFQKISKEFPSDPLADDAVERMGWICETTGDRSRAMDLYETLLVVYPHSDLAGDIRQRMQRIEKKQP
jgi:tetratricopeptide (TPR) repeat protein